MKRRYLSVYQANLNLISSLARKIGQWIIPWNVYDCECPLSPFIPSYSFLITLEIGKKSYRTKRLSKYLHVDASVLAKCMPTILTYLRDTSCKFQGNRPQNVLLVLAPAEEWKENYRYLFLHVSCTLIKSIVHWNRFGVKLYECLLILLLQDKFLYLEYWKTEMIQLFKAGYWKSIKKNNCNFIYQIIQFPEFY